jgi:hypothetical protein
VGRCPASAWAETEAAELGREQGLGEARTRPASALTLKIRSGKPLTPRLLLP